MSTPFVATRSTAPDSASTMRNSPATTQRSLQKASTTATYRPDGDAAGQPSWSTGSYSDRRAPDVSSRRSSVAVYHNPSPGPGDTTAATASGPNQHASHTLISRDDTQRTVSLARSYTQSLRQR